MGCSCSLISPQLLKISLVLNFLSLLLELSHSISSASDFHFLFFLGYVPSIFPSNISHPTFPTFFSSNSLTLLSYSLFPLPSSQVLVSYNILLLPSLSFLLFYLLIFFAAQLAARWLYSSAASVCVHSGIFKKHCNF